MDEIDVEIIRRMPEPEEGHTYRIEKVEYVRTPIQGLEGWRITLKDVKDGTIHETMLWKRERVGASSKLGAFLVLLGNKPQQWIGKIIEFVSWKPRNRRLRLAVEEGLDSVQKCVEMMISVLEAGKTYTIEETVKSGVKAESNIIEKAWDLLVQQGRAHRIPSKPVRWFYQG